MLNSLGLSRACAAAACASLVLAGAIPATAADTTAARPPKSPSFVLPDLSDAGGAAPLSRFAVSAVAADFNGDGDADTLVPNINRAGAVVLLGDGEGGLGAPIITALPSGGSVLVADAADLDGDGKVDAVVGAIDDTGGSIRVLRGKGNGSFALGQRIDYSGSTLLNVKLGDLNADGKLDVAAAVDQPAGDTVEVAFGKGDGTFGSKTVYAPEFSVPVDDLDLADVDGDADLDLVYLSGCPTVRLNKGDGKFGDQICSTDGTGRLSGIAQAVADFNGDGTPDLAVGDASGGHVTIGVGDGAGHFAFAAQYSNIGRQVNSLATADFTGDGVLDLVASADAYFAAPTRVMVLLRGKGDGTFTRQGSYATGGDGLTAADLDGDGLPDLISAGFQSKLVSSTLNEGKGVFHAPRVYAASSQGLGTIARAADMNGDGRVDVVAATKGGLVNVYLQKADGTLKTPPLGSPGSGQIVSVALADVNNDGKVDLVAGSFASDNIFIMLGKGDGKFGAAKSYNNGSGAAVLGVAVGDVNGDGKQDIVSNTFAALSVMLGKGDGTFAAPVITGSGAGFQVATVLADITGDGDLDAVAVIQTGSDDNAASKIVLNIGNGDGTFSSDQQITVDTNAHAAASIVLGKGQHPSIALVGLEGFHTGRTGLFVLANIGGHLAAPTYLEGPGFDLTVGDLNGDKKVDVATIGPTQLGIFLNSAGGTLTSSAGFAAGQAAFGIASGDIAGSSKIDLIELEDTNPQQVTVYENSTRKK